MFINKDNCVIYTSLIGQNEGINIQPFFKGSNFKRICFTDDKNIQSDDWEINYINGILPRDNARSQRNLKIRPHIMFPDYKYSLYLDNTIQLKVSIEEFITYIVSNSYLKNQNSFVCIPFHSFREKLIDEFNICAEDNLDDQAKFLEQMKDYIFTNEKIFNERPFWNAILLRSHNDINVINFSETWFAHVNRYTRRDQLSILHSAEQTDFKLSGFEIDNHNSEIHSWPITINNRKFRQVKVNSTNLLPINYLNNFKNEISLLIEKRDFLQKDIRNLESKKIIIILYTFKKFMNKFFNFINSLKFKR